MTTATVLLLAVPLGLLAADPDTFSPVVSYQYEDSLADPVTQPSIMSPVVAYQYFDWPGDENLTFQDSPAVSYFYYFSGGLTLTGTVSTPAGIPVPGAQITFKRVGAPFSLATSDGNGVFTAPGLATPANYTLTVTKSGYVIKITNLAFAGVGTQPFNLQLTPLPPAPPTVAVNRTPPTTAVRSGPDPSAKNYPVLMWWSGTQWCDLSQQNNIAQFYYDRPTVIITRGWVPKYPDGYASALDWTQTMAYAIAHNHPGLSNPPNILLWDWRQIANTYLPQVDDAAVYGLELGKALIKNFPNYNQHLHFIGHSLVTIVNANACDYVSGVFPRSSMRPANPWSVALTIPQATLLDEAEVAAFLGRQATTSASVAWDAAQDESVLLAAAAAVAADGVSAAVDWKTPIPTYARWMDNYVSAFGLRHGSAVNISLLAPTLALRVQDLADSAVQAYSYSHAWYQNSVTSTEAPVGYRSSLEGGGAFPPTGTGTAPGTLWWENTDTSDPYDLSTNRPNLGGIVDSAFQGDFPFLVALSGGTATLGNAVLSGYQQTIQWAGNIGGTVIYTTGQVASQSTQKVGLWWDAAHDTAADVLNSINPDQLLAGPLAAPVFGITLGTAPTAQANSRRSSALSPQQAHPDSLQPPGLRSMCRPMRE